MLLKNEEIFISVIAGVLLILFLVIIFIVSIIRYNAKVTNNLKEKLAREKLFEQEMLRSQLEAQEATFRQISEEFHDNIGQLLSSVVMLLGATERNLPQVPLSLVTAQETLGRAIQDIRLLSKSLSREWLAQYNLIDNLKVEINRINTAGIIQAKFSSDVETLPMVTEHQVILFRIVQETIQNSIKHSKAHNISIDLAFNESLSISMKDDGTGIDHNEIASSTGLGIMNIKNRVGLLNGTVEWKNLLPGTEVFIKLPVQCELS